MSGLWADGWFYISSAGLLVSGILFFFLLGQYRAASEAADVTEAEQGTDKDAPAPAAIRPVYIPDTAAEARVASHAEAKDAEARLEPKPKLEAEAAGAERRRDPANTTAGLSPAVVYLQNIKSELTELHKEMNALAKRVDDQLAAGSSRDEALIERLGELARVVENMKVAAPPAPFPKKSRKAEPEPAPEPAPEAAPEPAPAPAPEPAPAPLDLSAALTLSAPPPAPAPTPEPFPEPEPAPVKISETARRAEETIRMDLSALVAPEPAASQPAAETAVEPAPTPEAPPEEKPRRGPVWPV